MNSPKPKSPKTINHHDNSPFVTSKLFSFQSINYIVPSSKSNEAAGICPVTTHVLQTPDDLFVDLLILWQEITGDSALLDEINLDFSL